MPDPTAAALSAELERVTAFLHSIQRHPDFDYAVTFAGNTAHKSMEGWSPNPHAMSTAPNPAYREHFWMRRKQVPSA